MKIISDGKEFIIDVTVADAVSSILSVVRDIIDESDKIFYGLKINGQEVYEHFEMVLEENKATLETVEPMLVTKEQWTADTLYSIYEYTHNALPKAAELVENFYDNPREDAWVQLSYLIEGLQWIHSTSEYLPEYASLLDSSSLLENLNTAVTQLDLVLIGDLIQYEIVPYYEKIQTQLVATIEMR